MEKLFLASDYQEGAHPSILKRLCQTNLWKTQGYGTDEFCKSAREKICEICKIPEAAVYFLIGGTQTNAIVISALLKSYQGVIAAESGHISIHEAGAIELGGHKVLSLPHTCGKITAESIEEFCEIFWNDENHEHMVAPGMVYISQPTEYGTLYSLSEMECISRVCKKYHLYLYVDGARLAYGLASPENNVTLPDLARLADIFYIGGTKCGALFGEAVVLPDPNLLPHFFTIVKQHGALLAKGRILGIQFDTLFTEGLYERIGKTAIEHMSRMNEIFHDFGYSSAFDSPTNQSFILLKNDEADRLKEKIEFSFWEKLDEDHTVFRFATSWATTEDDVERLRDILMQN